MGVKLHIGGALFKSLVTILLLLNIFVGYFAEAYQGEAVDCDSAISQQLNHSSPDNQNSESQSTSHSDKECVTSHCHFGHCAAIKHSQAFKLHLAEIVLSEFNPNLSPIDFIFDLLRPPISA